MREASRPTTRAIRLRGARIPALLASTLLTLLAADWLSAQNPPPPVIPRSPDATAPPPAIRSSAPAASPAAGTGGGQVTLQYPNSPVQDILDFYERLTGTRIIRDANLAGANLSIEVSEPVPTREAIELIEAVLLLNGYVFIDAGENRVKIVNAAAKNPRSEGITLYANADELPEGEVVAGYFMPLNYISPDEAQPILQGYVQLHPYGSMVPVNNAQALVITENASVIRELIKLKELIDVPPAQVTTEFVQLHRADAEKVAEMVNQLLEARREQASGAAAQAVRAPQNRQQGGNGGAVPPAIQQALNQAGAAAAAAQAVNQSLVASDSQILADTRTNRVVIVSRPMHIPYLRDLVREFDEAVELMRPYELQLSYIAAAEALPVLVDLIAEGDEDADAAITEGGQAGNQTGPRQTTGGGTTGGAGGTSSTVNAPDRLGESQRQTSPQSVTVGSTTLIADNRANSILVIGPPESRQKVAEIMKRLDRRPMQVYLSTVIGQLTLNEGQTTGIDIIQKFANDGTHGIANSQITRTGDNQVILDPATLLSADAFPLAAGLTSYIVIDDVLDVFVSLLGSTNDFKILGRPTVFTQNNEKATILSGSRVAVPTQTLTDINNTTNTAVTSNIQFEDVVLKLEVIPLINAKREITLQVAQQNDNIIGEQTIGGNQVPTIGTQELTTTVTVPNRSTIVLGGLISTSKQRTETGIPWLRDIPLLGYLFRQTDDTTERQELIVMIQPTVVETPVEMIDESFQYQMNSELGREANNPAVFRPWDGGGSEERRSLDGP